MNRILAAFMFLVLGLAGVAFGESEAVPPVDGSAVNAAALHAGPGTTANEISATGMVVASSSETTDAVVLPEPEPEPVMELQMGQGGLVSLDFRDAEIRNVLKVLAYKGGMNIIAGPEVVGLVNIQLKDVPWQKALDVILSTYGYSYEQKGTIIMVTTVETLRKRREDAKILAEQEPISTETFLLNYAKAEEVKAALEKMKTPRGSVHHDTRTNAVIVSDVDSNVQLMKGVVERLDAVTPQVLIEARIVETTLNRGENLGIDWTLQASVTGSGLYTTAPFSAKTGNIYLEGTPPELPSTSLKYGTINFNQMQAALQMLKTRANTDVISNPRIVTLDNQPARITVGSQYPVPQYTYNQEQATLQVSGWSYLDIGVIFSVTPHVNSLKTGLITLDIEPTVTDILDYVTVENTQMPQLSSESAKTKVMIRDGETLVIGGLIKNKKTDTRKKVPLLGDIPLLGLPFQKKDASVIKTELVIFLTPHIVTPSATNGTDGAAAGK